MSVHLLHRHLLCECALQEHLFLQSGSHLCHRTQNTKNIDDNIWCFLSIYFCPLSRDYHPYQNNAIKNLSGIFGQGIQENCDQKMQSTLTIKLHQTKSFPCCISKLIEGEESGTQNNFSDKITTETHVDLYWLYSTSSLFCLTMIWMLNIILHW